MNKRLASLAALIRRGEERNRALRFFGDGSLVKPASVFPLISANKDRLRASE